MARYIVYPYLNLSSKFFRLFSSWQLDLVYFLKKIAWKKKRSERAARDAPGTRSWTSQTRANTSSSQGSSPSHPPLGPSLWRTPQLTPEGKAVFLPLVTFYLFSNVNKYSLSVHFGELNRIVKKHLGGNITPRPRKELPTFHPEKKPESAECLPLLLSATAMFRSHVKLSWPSVFSISPCMLSWVIGSRRMLRPRFLLAAFVLHFFPF